MPDLQSIEGIRQYRAELRDLEITSPRVPVALMPATLGRILDTLLAALPPPKHKLPTLPLGKTVRKVPTKPETAPVLPEGTTEPARPRKRRKRPRRGT